MYIPCVYGQPTYIYGRLTRDFSIFCVLLTLDNIKIMLKRKLQFFYCKKLLFGYLNYKVNINLIIFMKKITAKENIVCCQKD